ncbi:MAG: exosortase family protein XrtF [Lutibacter sp.]|nr:exosortase family protein XrtF [Lutibacter sp.]
MKGNKTVVLFLLKFFGTYLLLFLGYSFYLNRTQNEIPPFSCAPITKTVALQTKYLLNVIGYPTEIVQDTETAALKLFINGKFTAFIVEGCNAISIIILFIAFIVAFAGKFKTTVLYILFGSLLIYFTNIVRIVIISIALYEYPQYQHLLHEIIFPSIIYGMTFLLWFVWIRYFSNLKK